MSIIRMDPSGLAIISDRVVRHHHRRNVFDMKYRKNDILLIFLTAAAL